MTLNTLADRVEKLAGPDREVDAMIAVALDLEGEGMNPRRFRLLHTDYGGNNSYAAIGKHHPRLPAYTASLDAAMTLVPVGWTYINLEICARGTDEQHCRCSVEREAGDDEERVHAYAATPALALVAAALRARSEGEAR
jgi:hypothetical protein